MFRLFASKSSDTGNANENSAPRSDQDGWSTITGSVGGRRNGHTRGRSFGVQGLGAIYPNVLGARLTEEPPSLTDDSDGGFGRGKRAAAEAVPLPAHNEAQALANRLCELEPSKYPKPKDSLQLALIDNVEKAGKNEIAQNPSSKQAWAKPARTFSRRYSPGKSSVTTQNGRYSRYPLRIGTHPPLIFESAAGGGRPQPLRKPTLHETEVRFAPKSKAPFRATLYNGSCNLPSTPPTLPTSSTLHVLAVGVSYDELEDPEHDLNILTTSFRGYKSGKTRFKGISGKGATVEVIEKAVGEHYREILRSSDSNLLILFTGEGDSDNRMHLMGGEFITDKELRRWMWKLQIDCHPNNRTVTVIFDYCRPNPAISLGVSHIGVEFIWTCSPGETAAALKFPGTQTIPRSCFLLSLMMASHSFAYIKNDLITAINRELGRLLRFLELTHRKNHEAGRCGACNKRETCPKPYRPQSPDWQQSGNMKPVYDLVECLSKLDVVSEVYKLFTRNSHFCEANGLLGSSAFEPRSSHQNGTTQHSRGSSKPVHAALNIPTEPQCLQKNGLAFGFTG